MAIPWITLLRTVPWTEVINNAPRIVDGAKKLWSNVSRKSAEEEQHGHPQPATPSSPHAVAALEARVVELEATVADLQRELLQATEVIKSLADQNAQMVARIEENRVRMMWLSVTAGVVGVAAAAAIIVAVVWHV